MDRLKPSDAVALAREIGPALRAEGRRRQAAGKPLTDRHNTADLLAQQTGYSRHTLTKAIAVVEAAERDPTRYRGVVKEMDESGNVDRAYRKVIFASTALLFSQPKIFAATRIGGKPLGELQAQELRWLVAFFAQLGKATLPAGARHAHELFTAHEVKRAAVRADRSIRKAARHIGQLADKSVSRRP